jgi:predicted DsbA family dithiol-disulfide isomerase
LCFVAESGGISADEVIKILGSDQFAQEVLEDRKLASQLGATGVPFFVVDMKYAISGAQPLETFNQVLETAWSDR